MATLHPVPALSKNTYLEKLRYIADFMSGQYLPDKPWWYGNSPDYPYVMPVGTIQTTDIAAQMIIAISVLKQHGMASPTLIAQAEAAVQQMIWVAYQPSGKYVDRIMDGTFGGTHGATYCWTCEALSRAYFTFDNVDKDRIRQVLGNLWMHEPNSWMPREREQAMKWGFIPKYYSHLVGTPGMPSRMQAHLDTYCEVEMAPGASYFDGWEYHYGRWSPQTFHTSNLAYYAIQAVAGIRHLDRWISEGLLTVTPEQLEKIRNGAAHILASFSMAGNLVDVGQYITSLDGGLAYRSTQGVRNRADAMATIAVNPSLHWWPELPNYCRYLCDRWLEHLGALDGELLGAGGAQHPWPGVPPVCEHGGLMYSSGVPSYIQGPNSATHTVSEMAMALATIIDLGSAFFNIQPKHVDVSFRYNHGTKASVVVTPSYAAVFPFGSLPAQQNWPGNRGPVPCNIIDAKGGMIGPTTAYGGMVMHADNAAKMFAAGYSNAAGTSFWSSRGGTTGADSYRITDASGVIDSFDYNPPPLDLVQHLRTQWTGMAIVSSRTTLKTADASVAAPYDVEETWTCYRDFLHRNVRWRLTGQLETAATPYLYFAAALRPGRIIAMFHDGPETLWDGTTPRQQLQSGHSIATLSHILFKRDSRGGTDWNHGYVAVPLSSSFTLPTTQNSVQGRRPAEWNHPINRWSECGVRVVYGQSVPLPDASEADWLLIPLHPSDGDFDSTAVRAALFARTWWLEGRNSHAFRMFFPNGDSWGATHAYVQGDQDCVLALPATGHCMLWISAGRSYRLMTSEDTVVSLSIAGMDGAAVRVLGLGPVRVLMLREGRAFVGTFALQGSTMYEFVLQKVSGIQTSPPVQDI
ncbi:MAG: hypothetical protein HRF45_03725 [Fimbriimonadia bacterium]|jgi:hypothetical protein